MRREAWPLGRAVKWAGIILGALFVIGLVSQGGLTGGAHSTGRSDRNPFTLIRHLQPGDCFNKLPNEGSEKLHESVLKVPCGRTHDGELYGTVALTGDKAGLYPPEDNLKKQMKKGCTARSKAYILDPWAYPSQDVGIWYSYPLIAEWTENQHTGHCMFVSTTNRLQGSLRHDRTTMTADQYRYVAASADVEHTEGARPDGSPDAHLTAYRAWAARMASAEGREGSVLRTGPWPAQARTPAAALAGGDAKARTAWLAASHAPSGAEFTRDAARAVGDRDGHDEHAVIAVRTALDLPRARPGATGTT